MKGRGPLVCLGDIVEDVIVWPRTGSAVIGTDNPATVVRTRGGGAANVAALAATIGPTRFVGRVGDDPVGRRLTAELHAHGVQVAVQRAGRTGTIVILVDADGERTMFPDRGASAELADPPADWVADAAGLHISAYALAEPNSRRATLSLAEQARRVGAYISVDPASLHLLTEIGLGLFVELVRAIAPDVVIANAQEAALLAPAWSVLDLPEYIVKNGARPVTIVDREGASSTVDVPPVRGVKDTTGAGDAFAAGFLQSRLVGSPSAVASAAGINLAARVLSTPGAGLAVARLSRST